MNSDKFVTSWSTLYSFRREIKKRWPSVWNLPIAKKRQDLINAEMKGVSTFLDVGASNRELVNILRKIYLNVVFHTMDMDKQQEHDFYTLDEIGLHYDFVNISEVIEHVTYEEGLTILKKIHNIMTHGGKLYISTPNLHHPNRFWDIGHKTPYRYDELGAVLLASGFHIKGIYRIYNDSLLKRCFRIYVASFLHSYLDVDFAKSIAIVAEKHS